MEWTAFINDEAVAQSPIASTSTAVSTSDAHALSHPIPPMLARKLEPYRNKQTFPAGVAFFKRWAADMLEIDPGLKGEGLTPVELAAAANEAAESYNVRKLRMCTSDLVGVLILSLCDSSYADRQADPRRIYQLAQNEQEDWEQRRSV
jgi:hypothetical protein